MSEMFEAWPKIPRHKGFQVIVSEKIDGTNAAVVIRDGAMVACQSRKRIITPDEDNYGFAAWAHANEEALVAFLGEGRHFGKWAGEGIQKNPLRLVGKWFFLFNTSRHDAQAARALGIGLDVVPVIYSGEARPGLAVELMADLAEARAYEPEGIILYYPSTRTFEKATLRAPKGKWAEAA